MDGYFAILVIFIVTAGFVATLLILSSVLGPKVRSAIKDDPFECGTIGTGSPNERLSVRFYLVAMIFILFDVEVVFMYPWAVQAVKLGWNGYWVMVSFLAVLSAGLLYVWRRGVLDWG